MNKIARRTFLCLIAALLCAFSGYTQDTCASAPVRVAVYVGPGARSVGMFRWIQLVDQAPELKAIFVDGAAIRSGALRNADAVVMPGGKSYIIADELGTDGAEELRRFILDGGSYIGTCAGAILMLDDLSRERKMLGVAPFKKRSGSWGGEAMLRIDYTDEASQLSGITVGKHMERFNGGPVMDPSKPINGAVFKVFARFNCNLHTNSDEPGQPSMGGGASVVAGTYGKGRVWLTAMHPEYYPKTWDAVKAAFKFTTGRNVSLNAPQRRTGALSTGWWCDPGPGPNAAELACRLIRDDNIDLEPYSSAVMLRNGMRHLDALVVPDAVDADIIRKLSETNGPMPQIKAFMDCGGKVVTWGSVALSFAPHTNLLTAAAADAVPALLRDLKLQPPPAPRSRNLTKSENPVRVSMIFDNGVGGFSAVRWIELLSCTPDCVFTAVNGADVRAGALADCDLYIAPGGGASKQAGSLGRAGCSNLVEFVRNGGGFFGTCAGCYLALSRTAKDRPNAGRLNLVPYRSQKTTYRGGAQLKIRFTEHAGLLGFKPGDERTLRYHGGPVLLKNSAIEIADIRAVANYACDGVFATNSLKKPVMAGSPAIIAGTFGKGRIVATSPHPESFLHTQDMIRGGLKYITGRSFEADFPQRTRGNLSVAFHGFNLGKSGAMLASGLFHEPSLDIRPVDGEAIGYGELEHCDALVLCHPEEKIYTPFIREFAKNGGRIFVLDSKPKKAFVPKDLPNITVCKDAKILRTALVDASRNQRQ